MQVAIVGAGIAGLGAAIALRRGGHSVEVFERSLLKTEEGAAITVMPNAVHVLKAWGFDFERTEAVASTGTFWYRAETLEQVIAISNKDGIEKYGSDTFYFHRSDLHRELYRLAVEDHGAPGSPAKIHLNIEVVDVDCDGGILRFTDGSSRAAELVVIADGIHSKFTSTIDHSAPPLVPCGISTYRLLIPMDRVLNDQATRSLFDRDSDHASGIQVFLSPDRRLIFYPCQDFKTLNVVAMRPVTPAENERSDDYLADASFESLLQTYQDFHPTLIKVLVKGKNEAIKCWSMQLRSPLANVTRGKAVLIGDSAHPMLPNLAQGAAQALEDGAALGVLFSQNPHSDTAISISNTLSLFASLRQSRFSAIQLASNIFNDQPQMYERIREQVKEYLIEGTDNFETIADRFDYAMKYDVINACERVR